MATDNRDLLRLALGDPKADFSGNQIKAFFEDTDLDDMLDRSSGDVEVAATEGWRQKMAFYANTAVNLSEGSRSLSREDLYRHAKDMVEFYESRIPDSHAMINTSLSTREPIEEVSEMG